MATKSTSSRRCLAARSTIRPMRPNPLIATRAAMAPPSTGEAGHYMGSERRGLLVEERDVARVDAGPLLERDAEVGQKAREEARGARGGAVVRVGQGERHQ